MSDSFYYAYTLYKHYYYITNIFFCRHVCVFHTKVVILQVEFLR